MVANTTPISSKKLHCCVLLLILSILLFLSIPLLFIYLANNTADQMMEVNDTELEGMPPLPWPKSDERNNCRKFARDRNLTTIDSDVEPFQCPTGMFQTCVLCPDICIEQSRICNKKFDCPDKSDETPQTCLDVNGAFKSYLEPMAANGTDKYKNMTYYAKPESCTKEQFDTESCPCNFSDSRVIICERLGLTQVPETLPSSVFKIRMSNNALQEIGEVRWPRFLKSLVLVNNSISYIGKTAFQHAKNLSRLFLNNNNISYIDNDALDALSNLTWLSLESNSLRTFNSSILKRTPILMKLDLSFNMIELPDNETRFSHCKDLTELLLDYNQITHIRAHWFSKMPNLGWLSLSHNQISSIEAGSFDWNYELGDLNLSHNKIKAIHRQMFGRSLNIDRLYLGNNPLRTLPVDAFQEMRQLKSLSLIDIQFVKLNRDTFRIMKNLEFIYFAHFRYCPYADNVPVCHPITDGLSSTTELLAFPILKYAVWIVALVCSLGNVCVLIWRSVSPREDQTLSFFIKNLSIADLLMSVYLGTIGWQDLNYQHDFRTYAIDWMASWQCSAIGILAILSSELSVFILTIITIERYRSITSIKRFKADRQHKRAICYVFVAWILSLLIAFYPLIRWLVSGSDSEYYYVTNGLCLPLHIDEPFSQGWEYSAFIYLGVNFTAVIIIIALYFRMYLMIIDNRQMSRPALLKAERREDAIMAIRFFFIVITDCLCWIPIVVIKLMALTSVPISSSIYGWLVVFIIPINSALNPIVYTLAAPTSIRASLCRLFERLFYKFDGMASRHNYLTIFSQLSEKQHEFSSAALTDGTITTTQTEVDTTKPRRDSGNNLGGALSRWCARFLARNSNSSSSNQMISIHNSISICDTLDTSIARHTSVESAFTHTDPKEAPILTASKNRYSQTSSAYSSSSSSSPSSSRRAVLNHSNGEAATHVC